MTNPDLALVLRRICALVLGAILPAGALLLWAGRNVWAAGLVFGALVALVNAAMLVWRINRSADSPVGQAQRIIQQGMGIRFSLIALAAVVVVETNPAAIPGFLVGLIFGMALGVAVAARAILQAAATPYTPPAVPLPTPPAPAPRRFGGMPLPILHLPADTVSALADRSLGGRHDGVSLGVLVSTKRSSTE